MLNGFVDFRSFNTFIRSLPRSNLSRKLFAVALIDISQFSIFSSRLPNISSEISDLRALLFIGEGHVRARRCLNKATAMWT